MFDLEQEKIALLNQLALSFGQMAADHSPGLEAKIVLAIDHLTNYEDSRLLKEKLALPEGLVSLAFDHLCGSQEDVQQIINTYLTKCAANTVARLRPGFLDEQRLRHQELHVPLLFDEYRRLGMSEEAIGQQQARWNEALARP